MPPRKVPLRKATVTLATALTFSVVAAFSPASMAFAVDDIPAAPAAETAPAPASEPAVAESAPVEPAIVEPAPVDTAPVDPAPLPEAQDPNSGTPPTDQPGEGSGDPAAPPTEEPTDPATDPATEEPAAEEPATEEAPVKEPAPSPAPTPTPTAPAQPAPTTHAAPINEPAPPANQPPQADWSPGNPGILKYYGSGDQGAPAVGVNGLIGDNYPAYYKAIALDPVIWDEWNFAHRQCTSFVSWRLNQVNKVPFTNQYGGLVRWGNAGEWDDSARSLGIRVDTTPAVGAIAYSDPFTNGAGSAGHVAWVAKVLDDGRIVIEEYNAWGGPGMYGARIVPPDAFTGYIHLKDLAAELPTTTKPVAAKKAPAKPAAPARLLRDVVLNSSAALGTATAPQPEDFNGDGRLDALNLGQVSFAEPFVSPSRVRT